MSDSTESDDQTALPYMFEPPAGWLRIPVRPPVAAGKAVGTVIAGLTTHWTGSEAAAGRVALAEQFADRLAEAASVGGVELFIPPIRIGHASATEAILIAEVDMPTTSTAENPETIAQRAMAARPILRSGTVSRTVGLRADSRDEAVNSEEAGDDVCRVEYMLAMPNDPERRWLSIALTSAGGDASASAFGGLVEQFDSAVAALRWREA